MQPMSCGKFDEMTSTPFYKEGLIEVSSLALVKRYNNALTSLELPPTNLSSFHLDGRGWSPEIAHEQNNDYLSHGPANALAIILSPDQRDKPLYAPLTSFDKDVLQRYYAQFSSDIADITRTACLCLELNHTPPAYSGPTDVLGFASVTVTSSAGNFGSTLDEQAKLVKTFLEGDMAWFDALLRQKIISSAKQFGDLRTRAKLPPEFTVATTSSFYSKLFAGVFVLRPDDRNYYLIVREKNMMPSRQKNAFYLRDGTLLPKLLKDNLVAVDDQWYRDHPELLQNKYEALLADALFMLEPTLIFPTLTATQRKQRLDLYAGQLPRVLLEFEQFMKAVSSGASVRPNDLSAELIILLLHPHQDLPEREQEVLWRLLRQIQYVTVAPFDIAQVYQKDIAYFFELYQSWPQAKQQWAESYLRARGVVK
jgi:hypothetical protein